VGSRRFSFGPVALAAIGMAVALLGSAVVGLGFGPGRLAARAVSVLQTAPVAQFDFRDTFSEVATVTVINPSNGPVSIGGATTTAGGVAVSPWQLIPGDEDCIGATLQPLVGYCVITLRFTSIGKPLRGTAVITASDGTAQATLDATDVGLDSPTVSEQSIDFGSLNVGTTSQPHQITITPAPSFRDFTMMSVSTVDSPTAPGSKADYQPATDTCTGTRLSREPFVTCQLGETATPAAAGTRPAFLDIAYCDPNNFDLGTPPGGGSEQQLPPPAVPPGQELVCGHGDGIFYAWHLLVGLTATGIALPPSAFTPTLVANPPLAPAGRTTEVTGTGFPDNATVTFALVPIGTAPTTNLGTVPGVRTANTNGIGTFTDQVLVLMPHTAAGGYEILATANTSNATTPFLITPGTEQPPKFVDRH
jgi:hypothetical protein